MLVYVLWGVNLSSMKIGGREWDPLLFNGLRYLLIVPLLWLVCRWTVGRVRRDEGGEPRRSAGSVGFAGKWWAMERADLWRIWALGALSAVGMEAMLSYALQYSNTANGAVLGRGFMPVLTAAWALLRGEIGLTRSVAVGLPLAFGGVLLIVGVGGEGFAPGADTLRGDALLLLRSAFGAVYLVAMDRLVRRYPLPLLVAWEMTAGAVSLLPFVVRRANPETFAAVPVEGWISLAYTALFATVVGFSVHNWSLGRLGPFRAAAYGYLLPLTAAISGWALLGERLGWHQAVGGVAVLSAMYLVQRDRMRASGARRQGVERDRAARVDR